MGSFHQYTSPRSSPQLREKNFLVKMAGSSLFVAGATTGAFHVVLDHTRPYSMRVPMAIILLWFIAQFYWEVFEFVCGGIFSNWIFSNNYPAESFYKCMDTLFNFPDHYRFVRERSGMDPPSGKPFYEPKPKPAPKKASKEEKKEEKKDEKKDEKPKP